MNNLQSLHTTYQQSPWLDNLSRDLIQSGKLQDYINNGIRGITSNPTIFEHALANTDIYNEQIKQLKSEGKSTLELYWALAKEDIRNSTKILKPVYGESDGQDGFVSLEVAPELANDTQGTIDQARSLWTELNIENLFIKVPATEAGIPAIQTLLSENININITLLFGLDRYKQVIEAYKSAKSQAPNVHSVASFFVSRIDSEVDPRLTSLNTPESLALRGKVAVAQADLAYEIFQQHFAGADENNTQKLLWASSSTKNPSYPDLLYVENLVAPNTINTLTDATIATILEKPELEVENITNDKIRQAHDIMDQLAGQDIDITDVCKTLEVQGVEKFEESLKSLLNTVESESAKL